MRFLRRENKNLILGHQAGLFDAYALLRDEKAANTSGGTFSSGAWRTRDLNTESFDPQGIVSISSNQFTLQAGTYFIRALVPAHRVDDHQAKLANITDTTDALVGSSEVSGSNAVVFVSSPSIIIGRIVLTAAKVFEIQHRCSTTSTTNGFGLAANFGLVEVYTQVEIWREAKK